MPVDIKELTEGWLELESDPGLFSLLLEDFGVKGVQVEEIYDLHKPLDSPVYGFIFLFRWIEERRSRRKIVEQTEIFVKDEEIVNNIFFAQQMVPNSCATHALISILLNCPNIHLGDTLSRLKVHTHGMSPENKGWAIGNTPELACAHNSHAMPQAKRKLDKAGSAVSTGRFTGEAFHFVSFVPINGRLFELDGLKPFPIDHGPWSEVGDWTESFRSVMSERLGIAAGEQYHDIRFNLMAVVPDRRLAITHKLKMLKTNKQIVLDALQQLMRLKHSESGKPEAGDVAKMKRETVSSDAQAQQQPHTDDVHSQIKDIVASLSDTITTPTKSIVSVCVETKTEQAQQQQQVVVDAMASSSAPTTSSGATENKVLLCPLDYSTPLTIQTSPAPSTSSTDTSSEVGSAFNSPTQSWTWQHQQQQTQPPHSPSGRDVKKFVVIRVSDEGGGAGSRFAGRRGGGGANEGVTSLHKRSLTNTGHARVKTSDGDTVVAAKKQQQQTELLEAHTFAPHDLIALLRNLENEICICEMSLKDENDKQNKYKVDDCRRTHNYDDFICTFFSMLAEQGKLTDLVEQHLLVPKRPGTIPALKTSKTLKKCETTVTRKKRGRSKLNRRRR